MNKRLILFFISLAVAVVFAFIVVQFDLNSSWIFFFAAIVFFGILVSNQQYEEDFFSKTERVSSSFLFSYIVFFQFSYFPLSRFFFGQLVPQRSFPVSLLMLALFSIFFVLFGTIFLVLNASSRAGLLKNWSFLNNNAMFFVFRGLFISSVAATILLAVKEYA
jgi:hypothetical protein